jgi:hypothetical protein
LRASLDPPVTGEDAMIQNKNVCMQEKKLKSVFAPRGPATIDWEKPAPRPARSLFARIASAPVSRRSQSSRSLLRVQIVDFAEGPPSPPSRPRDDPSGKAGTASRAVVVRKNRVSTCVETFVIFDKSPASSNRRIGGWATVPAPRGPTTTDREKPAPRPPQIRSKKSCRHLCRDARNLLQVSCEVKSSNLRGGHRLRPPRPHGDRF